MTGALGRSVMEYLIVLVVVVLVIFAIVKLAGPDRYENMSSEEFEAEAKRGSRMGGAMAVLQKIVDPGHRVEYVQEQKELAEADGAKSGDRPETGPLRVRKKDEK
jgi:hypothetical protein